MWPPAPKWRNGFQHPTILGLLPSSPPHQDTWTIHTRWGHHFLPQSAAAESPWVSPACTWASVSPGKSALPVLVSRGLHPRVSARTGVLQGRACEVSVLSLPCSPALLSKDPGPLLQGALWDCSTGLDPSSCMVGLRPTPRLSFPGRWDPFSSP